MCTPTDWVQSLPRRISVFEWSDHAIQVAIDDGLSPSELDSVLLDRQMRVYRDHRHPERRLVIGRALDGPLVVLVVTLPDEAGASRVITVWRAGPTEQARYRQRGGSQYA